MGNLCKLDEQPPSPRPSPPSAAALLWRDAGEGESSASFTHCERTQSFDALSCKYQSSGDHDCDGQISKRRRNALPLPGGEGWGEGERKHISTFLRRPWFLAVKPGNTMPASA